MMTSPDELKARHSFGDYVYWTLFFVIHFIAGLTAISRHSIPWLIFYVVLGIATLSVLLKFYCSHCPHYIQGEKRLTCMFFWGIPKMFEARPGPLSPPEKAVSAVAAVIWILFPVFWLVLEPGLLLIYVLSWVVFAWTMKKTECSRCVYFHCPMNRVPEDARKQFEAD